MVNAGAYGKDTSENWGILSKPAKVETMHGSFR
jgi:hypothetical protein